MRLISAFLIAVSLSGPAFAASAELKDLIWSGENDKAIAEMKQDPASINAVLEGFTPLHLVSMVGNLDLAKFLVDNGADVNALDFEGYSPLVRAKANRNEDIAKLLISHGGKELRP